MSENFAANAVATARRATGKAIIVGLTCLVVLAVTGLSCVTYIWLMSDVFPSGLFSILCYAGAFANFILMIVLLAGKYHWFRPGAHEWASWAVTFLEVAICVLNLILAYHLAKGIALDPFMTGWQWLAPISPVFSMVGATLLILTSSDLQRRHKEMIVQEQKADADQQLHLQQHMAQITVQHKYIDYLGTAMQQYLDSPTTQQTIANHAQKRVEQTLSLLSGIPVAGQLPPPIVNGSVVKPEAKIEQASFAQTTQQLAAPPPDYAALMAELEQLRRQQQPSPLQGNGATDPTKARPEEK